MSNPRRRLIVTRAVQVDAKDHKFGAELTAASDLWLERFATRDGNVSIGL